MRFGIDVAYLDVNNRVIAVTTMRQNRLGWPRLHSRAIVEAEAGAFAR